MLARILALETALLMAVALKYRRIQIQRGAESRPLKLPEDRQMFDLAAHETAEVAGQRHG